MSSPATVRQRGGKGKKDRAASPAPAASPLAKEQLDNLAAAAGSAAKSQWDYKLALVVITALAFVTRFWGIGHPAQVVFDEVHFGKVGSSLLQTRKTIDC